MHSRRAPGKLAADSYLKATAAVASPPTLFRDGRLKLDHGWGGGGQGDTEKSTPHLPFWFPWIPKPGACGV